MRQQRKPSEFGEWLLPRLKTRGWLPERLAQETNVNSSLVGKWIYTGRPSAASCELIADALLLDVGEVLEAAGYPAGRSNAPSGELRAEAVRLIEAVPESLLLPYVIGMRAIVSHGQPSLLTDELKHAMERDQAAVESEG